MNRELSCINTIAILEYAHAHHIDVAALINNLDPEIDSMDNPIIFLTDSTKWVSSDIIVKLLKRVKTILGDEDVPYEIGKYAVENDSFGRARMMFIKGFWSYKKALKNAQSINDQYNRTKNIELVQLKGNKAIIRLHWHSQLHLSKDLCAFNQGTMRYLPKVWGGIPLTLQETRCFFEGASYCEYHLKSPVRNRFYEIYSKFFMSKAVLSEVIKEMEADKAVIEKQYDEVNRLNIDLNQKMKQLLAIQETGKAILSVLNLEQLLTVIIDALTNICQVHRAIIMLINDEKKCLEYIYSKGFSDEVLKGLSDYQIPLHRVSNILVRVVNSGLSEYSEDVSGLKLLKSDILLPNEKSTSIYILPLITRARVIGVIATDEVGGKGIPNETREMFEIFAPQIAIAIENARLYRKLQDQVLELKNSRSKLNRAEKFSFLANLADKLAYEIQGPMIEIESFIKQLPQKFYDEDFRNEFYKEALVKTNRVNNLILELLDLAKTKNSQFAYNDIHDLIDKMILVISPQSNAKKIEITRQFDPNIAHVWIDADKMKQAILNILSNAVEFTLEGGRIEIFTRDINPVGEQHMIRIEIKDNGAGISESELNKIFDPYFTMKSNGNGQDRTGLGLFIANQNIQDHGGSIEVESRIQKGTTFFIRFSLKADGINSETEVIHDN